MISTPVQLQKIAGLIQAYTRLPFIRDSVPGAFLEEIIAEVRSARVLPTKDYVDVVDDTNRVGWSIKSAKSSSPLTWKRASIGGKVDLIKNAESEQGLSSLGTAILSFCNSHSKQSMKKFDLDEIYYARLVIYPNRKAQYFERLLCSKTSPDIFDPTEITWRWSGRGDDRPALHGFRNGVRVWSWHQKENQLHYNGENDWFPTESETAQVTFELPSKKDKLAFDEFLQIVHY